MSELYYGEYVVIPYKANWRTVPQITLKSKTGVNSKPKGNEQRATEWAVVRREQKWLITGFDGEQCGKIEETLRVAQEDEMAACPYFLAMRKVASVDGTAIELDYAADLTYAAGWPLWWCSRDGTIYGVVNVLSATDETVTLVSKPDGLTTGCFIAPLLLGRVETAPEIKEINGAGREWTIRLTETGGDNMRSSWVEADEALTMELGLSGNLVTFIYTREVSEALEMEIGISGSLIEMVVGITASEAMSVDLGVSGAFATYAFNTDAAEAIAVALGLSGSFGTYAFNRDKTEKIPVALTLSGTLE